MKFLIQKSNIRRPILAGKIMKSLSAMVVNVALIEIHGCRRHLIFRHESFSAEKLPCRRGVKRR